VKVCKAFRFDAAHYLPGYVGKCANMHGHSWTLEVEVEGLIQHDGMVVDFAVLKKVVNDAVVGRLDHQLLNEIIDAPTGRVSPTCENILTWIADMLFACGTLDLYHISRLRLYEAPDSFAEIAFEGGEK